MKSLGKSTAHGVQTSRRAATRLLKLVQSLAKDHAGKSVVCVTHAEPIAALLGQLKGTPGAMRYPPGIPLGSITVVDVPASGDAKEVLAKYEPAAGK